MAHLRLYIRQIGLLFGMLLLAGCASFRGAPEPITAADAIDPAVCPSNADVLAYYRADDAARSGLAQDQFRDFKISACIAAIDLNYAAFLKELRRQRIGTTLGGDLAVLTLSGIAAVANEGTANALAAASAGVVGARVAIDKDLYFEQTLPALESIIAANRAQVLLQIRTRQGGTSPYTLADARIDIQAYQEAGNVDNAIKGLNGIAAKADSDAAQKLAAFRAKPLGEAVVDHASRMTDYIAKLVGAKDGATKLKALAVAFAIAITDGQSDQKIANAISSAITHSAYDGTLDKSYDKIKSVDPEAAKELAPR
jgi:hypothetical protein